MGQVTILGLEYLLQVSKHWNEITSQSFSPRRNIFNFSSLSSEARASLFSFPCNLEVVFKLCNKNQCLMLQPHSGSDFTWINSVLRLASCFRSWAFHEDTLFLVLAIFLMRQWLLSSFWFPKSFFFFLSPFDLGVKLLKRQSIPLS